MSLASEIFGRLRELKDQEHKETLDKQSQLVKMFGDLGSQIDWSDAETAQTYLGHMQELINPHMPKGYDKKGFWDFVNAASGYPNDNEATNLGKIFNRATQGTFVTSNQAKKAKGTAEFINTFIGADPSKRQGGTVTPEQEAKIQQAMADKAALRGKMILRDPRQEALTKLQTQYELQYAAALEQKRILAEQAQQMKLERDKAQHKFKIQQIVTSKQMNANEPILRLAYQLWGEAKMNNPEEPDLDERGMPPTKYLYQAGQMGAEQFRENVNNKTADTNLKIANKDFVRGKIAAGAFGGSQGGDLPQKRYEASRFKDADAVMQRYTKAQKTFEVAYPAAKAAEQSFQGIVDREIAKRNANTPEGQPKLGWNELHFNYDTGAFEGSNRFLVNRLNGQYDAALKKFRKDAELYKGSVVDMKSASDTARGMSDYLDVQVDEQGFGRINVKPQVQGTQQPRQAVTPTKPSAPTTPTAKGKSIKDQPSVDAKGSKTLSIEAVPAESRTQGKTFKDGDGTEYRVDEIFPNSGTVMVSPVAKATPPPKATKGKGVPGDGNTVAVPTVDSTGKPSEAAGYTLNQEVTPKFLKGIWIAGERIVQNGREMRVLRRKE